MPTTLKPIGYSVLPPSAEAFCILQKDIPTFWPLASHWIKSAMERGDLGSFATVEADVLSGHASLWLMWDDPLVLGATVTQLITQNDRPVCMIVACGGENVHSWIHLVEEIEKYARSHECECVRIVGRKGWINVLPEYKVSRVILEKVLD